jgi:hypothetical protein
VFWNAIKPAKREAFQVPVSEEQEGGSPYLAGRRTLSILRVGVFQ